MTGIAAREPLEIILMLGLGFPEITGRSHLGDHLARPQARCIHIGDGVLRLGLLLF